MKLTLYGAARTKKTSPIILRQRAILLPNPEFTRWLNEQLADKAWIKEQCGDRIPIQGPCSIAAKFYRESNTGDWTGYVEALADALQSDVWKCQRPTFKMKPQTSKNKRTGASSTKMVKVSDCAKKVVSDEPVVVCPHCQFPVMKLGRRGLGILLDDRAIRHWDGTRLLVDKADPRIELEIFSPPQLAPGEVAEAVQQKLL